MTTQRWGAKHYLANIIGRVLLGAMLALPYRWRVPLAGLFTSFLAAPIAGYNSRAIKNLSRACPNLSDREIRRLIRAASDNFGRTLIEIASGPEFVERVRAARISGPGVNALERAHNERRPVILISAHFGNYDAVRAALLTRGYRVGALYNPMRNGYFNSYYVHAISQIGNPLFPRTPHGFRRMISFLRSGGMLGILFDRYEKDGEPLMFFGRIALTSLKAAELSKRYSALVVPIYGIRKTDGLSFDIVVEEPLVNSNPIKMTQDLNNSLEARIRANLDQWLWIHNRWGD